MRKLRSDAGLVSGDIDARIIARNTLMSADDGAFGNNEADKGKHGKSSVRGVSAFEKALLGQTFLGTRLLLRDGRADDGRDD